MDDFLIKLINIIKRYIKIKFLCLNLLFIREDFV